MVDDTTEAPRIFISYSHDSQEHKDWVLQLATRLVANGVDVILDQWDLRLGGDLPRFMESGLIGADRILTICTDTYVRKANQGAGGVGYEKMILTAQLMQDVTTDRVIPVIRSNTSSPLLPTFLGARVYIDFRTEADYETKYTDLIREIHGEAVRAQPPLGPNPFKEQPRSFSSPTLATRSERYVSAALSGTVTFDYSNNDGRFVIGTGDLAFETAWSSASNNAIHAYRKSASIHSVALALGASKIEDIEDANIYDTSSWTRTPRLGEIVVWQNSAGYFAVTQIVAVAARSHGEPRDELTFTYVIQPNRSASFKKG
jgi:hypothetical protein